MPVATAISVYMYPMQAGSPCATVFGLVGVPCVPRYVVILGEVLTYPHPGSSQRPLCPQSCCEGAFVPSSGYSGVSPSG